MPIVLAEERYRDGVTTKLLNGRHILSTLRRVLREGEMFEHLVVTHRTDNLADTRRVAGKFTHDW